MWQTIIRLGSPRRFYRFCGSCIPWAIGLSMVTLGYGLVGGLWLAPTDYQQGEAYRIIYVHVPCAMLSLLLYVSMAISSAVFLIWRIKLADIVAYCTAPIGMVFTLCALVTGSIWGKPMWGTWWIWDARLTSELILLFLYLGYLGLYHAMGNQRTAAKACAILAIIGVIDIPIIHYSVYWWNTLHQGATISQFAAPAIDSRMLKPLLSMIVGLSSYTVAILCLRVRTEIMHRGKHNQWVSAMIKKSSAGVA